MLNDNDSHYLYWFFNMLATLLIVFREMVEAGLIIGIVLAATRGVVGRSLYIGYGIVTGIAGACSIALFAHTINEALEGIGQEVFNISILSLAVIMLAWHNVWMSRHARHIRQEMRAVGESVAKGKRSLIALAVVVGIAVLREGAEIVLFLYGILLSEKQTSTAMLAGAIMGIALGGGLAFFMYAGLLRIPARYVFKVTSILITLLAAGMAAQVASLLQQAGIITSLTEIVWDSSHFISSSSLTGKILHTLIGYEDHPTVIQLVTYFSTLLLIFTLMHTFKTPSLQPK